MTTRQSHHIQPKAKATSTPTKPAPQIGEYNGKPTITLRRSEDDKYPFTFGQSKARLILEHLDAIRDFATAGA